MVDPDPDPDISPQEQTRLEIKTGRLMQELVESRSWQEYRKVLEARVVALQMEIGLPVYTFEEALRQNTAKGTIAGLRLALDTPQFNVDNMKRLVALQQAYEQEEREDEANDDVDA